MIHISPKRRTDTHQLRRAAAYDYYAAFSHSFVERLIIELGITTNDVLMDPWNGRGTTTTVAAEHGLRATGFDLNPAMVAMAEARLVHRPRAIDTYERVKQLRVTQLTTPFELSPSDGLLKWLIPSSVIYFRQLQKLLREIAKAQSDTESTTREGLVSERRMDFFLNLGLCSTLRNVLTPLKTSNPTWIPLHLPAHKRLRPSADFVLNTTKFHLKKAVSNLKKLPDNTSRSITVQQADSRFIPLAARSVSAVITSPPYCTRIDYAVATSPELFMLDLVSDSSFRALRDRFLGTTTTHLQKSFRPPNGWGPKCIETVTRIKKHPSKASSTYYVKNFLQYFEGLHDSLEEINRVTASGACIALVVQDSFYKDIHIDLPGIVIDMAAEQKWHLTKRHDHAVSSTMAASNPKSRHYRDAFAAVEAVLIFEK